MLSSEVAVKTPAEDPLVISYLGMQPYAPVWEAMKGYTRDRTPDSPDQLWLLEHQPVFTQGQAGKAEHLLATGDIPVVQVDRGGQVTYHGPGQLVGYVMIDLARRKMGARELVSGLENTLIATLAEFDITARARPDAPGVYVGERKIASLGLRVSRGKSFHGLALNVNADLEPFLRINPCGYQGMEMVNMMSLNPEASLERVTEVLVQQFCGVMGYNPRTSVHKSEQQGT